MLEKLGVLRVLLTSGGNKIVFNYVVGDVHHILFVIVELHAPLDS